MALVLILVLTQVTLEPLTDRLGTAGYLTGTFTQTDYWALTMDSESTTGTLHLAHPNLFLLEYDDIPGRATGCTGTGVFTVDPEFQEILVYEGSPAGFLHILGTGEDGSTGSSSVQNGDSVTVTLNGSFDGGITSITAGYTLSDSLPFLLTTVDTNGNWTTWDIGELDVQDTAPEPGVFTIPELEGYTLVDAGAI